MPPGRRFFLVYLALTAAFWAATVGFAAAGLWVVALATLAMAGAMTAASRGMRPRPRRSRAPDPGPRD